MTRPGKHQLCTVTSTGRRRRPPYTVCSPHKEVDYPTIAPRWVAPLPLASRKTLKRQNVGDLINLEYIHTLSPAFYSCPIPQSNTTRWPQVIVITRHLRSSSYNVNFIPNNRLVVVDSLTTTTITIVKNHHLLLLL